MWNLQSCYHFKLNVQKADQHTAGKWLIYGTKHKTNTVIFREPPQMVDAFREAYQIHCKQWVEWPFYFPCHYGDVRMGAIASQITSLTIVYSTVYLDADQGKRQSSASLAFVRGNHRGPVISPHKWPVTRKVFLFDDVIMTIGGNVAHVKDIGESYDVSC